MADELVSMQDQFSGLDMGALIGGPLKAACDAQIMMAKATSDFIQHVGMDDVDEHGVRKIRTVDFSFARPSTSGDGNGIGMEKVNLSVPLLSIVKIPTLSVDDVDVTFDMEVKSSVCSEKTSDRKGEVDGKMGVKVGPFSANVSIKGSISAHESNTRKSDNSAKYHVQVHAKDSGMPEGLAKVLDILSTASAPAQIEAIEQDGKGGSAQGGTASGGTSNSSGNNTPSKNQEGAGEKK
ncbi:MAG: DUF2589 domain-containing protein [Roseburia sp.]|nr:DUF2589 domain-containing protein [Roseburia sp.]